MSHSSHPYRLFAVVAGVGLLAVVCLAAWVIAQDRELAFAPDQRYHFQGKIEGLGPVEALLSVGGGAPSLHLLTTDGREWLELFGERRGGAWCFAEVDYQGEQARTNRTILCTPLSSPLALLGSVQETASSKRHDFELQPVATYEVLRRQTGFRMGQRGWRTRYSGAIPRFLTASDLETEAVQWLHQEVADRAKRFVEELKPNWSERWRYFWEPTATAEWALDTVWCAEYRSAQVLSLRADHYRYTGGAHGNLETECHTYWAREGDVQRVQLADLFKAGSDWDRRLSDLIIADLKRRGAGWVQNGERRAFTRDELPVFTVSNLGIAFYFDPYAVGPYAEGRYRVFVPFKALESCLNSEGVIADLRASGKK